MDLLTFLATNDEEGHKLFFKTTVKEQNSKRPFRKQIDNIEHMFK